MDLSASVAGGVLILDSAQDFIDVLCIALQLAGIPAFGILIGNVAVAGSWLHEILLLRDPAVVVFDLTPPYEVSWRLFERLRSEPAMASCVFVLTTGNPFRTMRMCGPDQRVFDILERPADVGAVLESVREALRVHPSAE